jgi:hypothetical protein
MLSKLFRVIALVVFFTGLMGGQYLFAQTVQFRPGETAPPPFSISPENPTACDVIDFEAILDGVTRSNACSASWAPPYGYNGFPRLHVNNTSRTIDLSFSDPAEACATDYDPVNGVEGNFGQLLPGYWTFRYGQAEFSFYVEDCGESRGLDDWNVRSSQAGECLNAVTYGEGLFVAVGNSGTITTSENGTNWTLRSPCTHESLAGVAHGEYNNGRFVAVGGYDGSTDGSSHTLACVSDDGLTWTAVDVVKDGTPQSMLYGIAYGNGLFLAMDAPGRLFRSADGVNWSYTVTGSLGPSLFGITFGNGLFVLVGYNGAILTTPDGVDWTLRELNTANLGSFFSLNGVAYGSGLYVAVGKYGTIFTSEDAISWTARNSGTTVDLEGVGFGCGVFTAVGVNGTILTSTDGINWSARDSGVSSYLGGVTSGAGTFVALGAQGTVLQSDPLDCGPRSTKEGELDYLNSLVVSITHAKQKAKVQEAIKNLTLSLSPSYWADNCHLVEPGGYRVFDYEKTTVVKLREAIGLGLNAGLVQSTIDRLVGADRELAAISIADAIAAGGNASTITKAQAEFDKGDLEAAANKADRAIDKYKAAWKLAVSAY